MSSGKVPLAFADRLAISNVVSCGSAVLAAIGMGTGRHSFNLLVSLIAYPFLCLGIALTCLVLTSIFSVTRVEMLGPYARWSYFPFAAAAAGVGLPFLMFPIIPVTPKVGAITGFAAGVGCAWLWGYVEQYRITAPSQEEAAGRVFFRPSWLGSKRRQR